MLRTCVLLVAVAQSCFDRAIAASLVVFPVADASAEDRTDPSSGVLRDGLFDSVYLGTEGSLQMFAAPPFEQRAAMEFPLELSVAQTITSAKLRIRVDGRTPDPMTLTVRGYAGDGQIQIEDFGASLDVAQIELPWAIGPGPNDTVIDVTPLLRMLDANHSRFAGFAFQVSNFATLGISSNENFTAAWRPRLEIEYATVPEPSAFVVALVCTGMLIVVQKSHVHAN